MGWTLTSDFRPPSRWDRKAWAEAAATVPVAPRRLTPGVTPPWQRSRPNPFLYEFKSETSNKMGGESFVCLGGGDRGAFLDALPDHGFVANVPVPPGGSVPRASCAHDAGPCPGL